MHDPGPNRPGLQRVVVGMRMVFRPLAGLPIPEGGGKLSDSKNALLTVSSDLLLTHTPQEAEVVLFSGQVVAPLAELEDLAMIVQYQLGRRTLTGHLLNFPKETI